MADIKHHAFGPSSLKRRELCPASYRLEKDLPSVESQDSIAGTGFHAEVAAMIEKAKSCGYDEVIEGRSEEAIAAFNKYTEVYADACKNAFNVETGKMGEVCVYVEHPVSFSYAGIEKYSGTADVLIVTPDKVIGIDWKFGHRFVDSAENNTQGAGYALAAMQMFKRDVCEFHFFNPVIHQDSMTVFDNKTAIATFIMGVIAKCEDENAPAIPGEEQCRYCKAAYYGTCPAHAKAMEMIASSAKAIISLPSLDVVPPETLVAWMKKFPMFEKFMERVKNRVISICEANGECGPYRLKEISGGREFCDIGAAFAASGLSNNDFMDCCSASVSKVEKTYAKNGKASGAFKTEKEAKEDFASRMAEVIRMKPNKITLVEARG